MVDSVCARRPNATWAFPYQQGLLTPKQTADLYARYSWAAYCVSLAATGGGYSYQGWVDRGRLPPTHKEFATYISWVINNCAKVDRKLGHGVTSIKRSGKKWTLQTRVGTDCTEEHADFDGVVVTGPGPPRDLFNRPKHPCITDGKNFWLVRDEFLEQVHDVPANGRDPDIVICGSGGTAAAIAAWIAREAKPGTNILVIANQAALFTRTENFFENALFSDEEKWRALDLNAREDFTKRLNRGVVWANVSDELSTRSNITFQPGKVEGFNFIPKLDGPSAELVVSYCERRG